MYVHFVTLFPEMVLELARYGVVGRAVSSGQLRLGTGQPRDFAADLHRTVDDRPYGGGPGMVMKVEPLTAAVTEARAAAPPGSPVVVLGPQGRRFDDALARRLARLPGMILVAGRYEGIDERFVEAEADMELSIGDYVLSGGELAAMVIVDAIARLVPGVLGAAESAADESFADGLLDHPHYTRPEQVGGRRVPAVLLSGDHELIRKWRIQQALGRTWLRRPDLLEGRELDKEQKKLLADYLARAGVDGGSEDET